MTRVPLSGVDGETSFEQMRVYLRNHADRRGAGAEGQELGQPVRADELFAEIGPWESEIPVGRS